MLVEEETLSAWWPAAGIKVNLKFYIVIVGVRLFDDTVLRSDAINSHTVGYTPAHTFNAYYFVVDHTFTT